MPSRWLIIADDLTGAADCAIPFALRGAEVTVHWGAAASVSDVVSFDAATRGLSAAESAERHRKLLATLPWQGRRVFKKIDSTLRGQPAAEIAAMMMATGLRRAICAPAFPAMKRVTRHGCVMVDGVPLEQTELWKRDHTYSTGDVGVMLAVAGLPARKVSLAIVRGGADRLTAALEHDGVAVCDAESDGDLDRIVAAGLGDPDRLWVGSAGLAHALARATWDGRPQPLPVERRGGGILVVAGSQAAATREAVARLGQTADVRCFSLGGALEDSSLTGAIREALASGDACLSAEAGDSGALDPEVADRLGRLAASVADSIAGLVATGGETASAVLRHLGIDGIRLADEVEAGVPFGIMIGRLTVPIVTKAGAFGDGGTLARAVMRIREARRRGATQ